MLDFKYFNTLIMKYLNRNLIKIILFKQFVMKDIKYKINK